MRKKFRDMVDRKKREEERESLRLRLQDKYRVPDDHPKADLLFQLAWEYGHSSGELEVEFYYADLVELIDA